MAGKSIIIIGAGMAGLSAGCYGQMNGYRTRIFESHTIPGGLCTGWKRKGYTFDGCLHWLMGVRSGIFHRFYQELGAVQGVSMYNFDEFARVEGEEGKVLILHADVDRLQAHLKELSPADGDVINELCKGVRALARMDPPVEKPMELMRFFDKLGVVRFLPSIMALGKWSRVSINDFALRFRDPFLRSAFHALAEVFFEAGSSMAGPMMGIAQACLGNGGLPGGGSLEFAKAIERRYLDLGGEVSYGERVGKILVENNRAIGVRLDDGAEHRADDVISAADGHTTIFDMLEGKYVDDAIRIPYREWPIYGPCLYVSFGVARDLSKEPHALAFLPKEPLAVAGDEYTWLHVHHYSYDPTMAPSGKSSVTVHIPKTSYEYWSELHKDPERYKAEKLRLADAVIARLNERFPGIAEQVEAADVATPVTYERYTGNWRGSYMGWLYAPSTAGKNMKRTLPGLGSFYLAGQWITPGGGIPGAIMSGRHVVQILCKNDSKRFVTATPQ